MTTPQPKHCSTEVKRFRLVGNLAIIAYYAEAQHTTKNHAHKITHFSVHETSSLLQQTEKYFTMIMYETSTECFSPHTTTNAIHTNMVRANK